MPETKIDRDWFARIEAEEGPIRAAVMFLMSPNGRVTVHGSGLAASNAIAFRDAMLGIVDDLERIAAGAAGDDSPAPEGGGFAG